ncbi:MAG: RdgB/HAM1 family non-canonical purine NTP pyrophosphatase [Termitinemataceae bacterium]|nr:MAG: RdgB/HAM1 family non-canonical purine NTP pyrophosphatase [Termitinemataceae bacterium]
MILWFASGNDHKKKEIQDIANDISKNCKIKIPLDDNIHFDPIEDGKTFLDNAIIKAKALYSIVHEPCLADDSGLCVDCLEGSPGIYSSRYGAKDGILLTDTQRNNLLLSEVNAKNISGAITARFICAAVLLIDENRFIVVQETLEGEITKNVCGTNGFGYDPIFYLPQLNCNLAELSTSKKNKISHRAKAMKVLLQHTLVFCQNQMA